MLKTIPSPLIEFVDENRLLLYFPGDSVDI